MDKEKLVAGIVGGVVAGFSIGVGFMIAQKTMGRFFYKKASKDDDTKVADAVKQGVTEGVKQAKLEEDAANFAAMTAMQNSKSGKSRGRDAMNQMLSAKRSGNFMGFDGNFEGNPNKMQFNGDPLYFSDSPNAHLNSF